MIGTWGARRQRQKTLEARIIGDLDRTLVGAKAGSHIEAHRSRVIERAGVDEKPPYGTPERAANGFVHERPSDPLAGGARHETEIRQFRFALDPEIDFQEADIGAVLDQSIGLDVWMAEDSRDACVVHDGPAKPQPWVADARVKGSVAPEIVAQAIEPVSVQPGLPASPLAARASAGK